MRAFTLREVREWRPCVYYRQGRRLRTILGRDGFTVQDALARMHARRIPYEDQAWLATRMLIAAGNVGRLVWLLARAVERSEEAISRDQAAWIDKAIQDPRAALLDKNPPGYDRHDEAIDVTWWACEFVTGIRQHEFIEVADWEDVAYGIVDALDAFDVEREFIEIAREAVGLSRSKAAKWAARDR